MELNCIIIDDEPFAHKVIESYVARLPFIGIVGNIYDPTEAVTRLNDTDVDMVFLDIDMPQISGMILLKMLEIKQQVIVTTAHPDFALETYEYSVCDFLLKPFSFERFLKAVNKGHKNLLQFRVASSLGQFNSDAAIKSQTDFKLTVKADKKIFHIDHAEILFIEGLGNYVKIHLKNSQLVVLETLKSLEDRLPKSNFIRTHKSYIVSLSAIRLIDGNQLYVDGRSIPIGTLYRSTVLSSIKAT